ncbi:hypothetical protein [Neorhizobium galegae]|uniref:hypothetical protein n=1 Tax=Neorhizobium galegae TaxID=399 RepID=UPI0006220FD1|nr:hypothetical protein [Neorhizobium galegae]CDZ29370.1 Hypothetical protein NGAL_HAMBI490_42360 [Neorhizobium galegae bv. officinalis]KAA9386440.1 hypothetical protein F4V88_08135 [Neorhizobium galegae]KAB1112705.1 hypothetical protein F4V89_14830 [Neorhizobium galegae]MCM2500636.1 hypothetical protein [Neorhizobium galegae]MCQ1764671.1 hypothetical protein [Neorhizobium galegae]
MKIDRIDMLLGVVAIARVIPLLVYAGLVVWIITLVAGRSETPEPVARLALQRNHQIDNGDLQTPAFVGLVGKYLKQDVAAGDKVTAAMLEDTPLPAPLNNTMAAIISIPLQASKAAGIKAGSDVQICDRNNQGFGGLTKVISVDCDERLCQVTVTLPKMPGQTVDPDVLAGASLLGGQYQTCSARP